MKTVNITLTSKMPLLMHADNIDWADKMEEWKNDPNNKGKSKAGDDRTPPWRWIGCLNFDDPTKGVVTIPSEYIMRCIMAGAAMVPTGKGKTTFKSLSQSGLVCGEFQWPLLVNGNAIPMADVREVIKAESFKENCAMAEAMGFSLFVKRAGVNGNKHIRVRPRFDNWSARGTITIVDDAITVENLRTIMEFAGRFKGLGDWRPSAPKMPGPFGTFEAKVS